MDPCDPQLLGRMHEGKSGVSELLRRDEEQEVPQGRELGARGSASSEGGEDPETPVEVGVGAVHLSGVWFTV